MKFTQTRLGRFGLIAILALYLGLTFATISRYSFWFDESYSAAITEESFTEAVSLTAVDVHPPLYYGVLTVWRSIFGDSDLAMRSLSAVFGVVALSILYVLLRRFFDRRASLCGVLFAAIGPYMVRFGQEARMYTIAASIILAATLVLVVLMQRPVKQRSMRLWVLYGVLIALALYTHYFSGLILIPHAVYVLGHYKGSLKERYKQIGPGKYYAGITALVLFGFWLPTLIVQFVTVSGGFWIPRVSELSFTNLVVGQLLLFTEITQRNLYAYLATIALIVFSILLVRYVRSQKGITKQGMVLLLMGFALPVVTLFIISAPGTSYFYSRYFAQYSPLFYGLLGVVSYSLIRNRSTRKGGMVVGLALVGILTYGTVRVLQGVDKTNNTMHETYQVVNTQYVPGDAVVALDFGAWFDANHYNQTPVPVYYRDQGFDYGSLEVIFRRNLAVKDLSRVNSVDRIWVVASYEEQDVELPESWGEAQQVVYGNGSFIRLYDLSSESAQ